jgi:hypothetical protein
MCFIFNLEYTVLIIERENMAKIEGESLYTINLAIIQQEQMAGQKGVILSDGQGEHKQTNEDKEVLDRH